MRKLTKELIETNSSKLGGLDVDAELSKILVEEMLKEFENSSGMTKEQIDKRLIEIYKKNYESNRMLQNLN